MKKTKTLWVALLPLICTVAFAQRTPDYDKVVPQGQTASAVKFFSPVPATEAALDFRMQGSEAVFTVPKINVYGVVTVSW